MRWRLRRRADGSDLTCQQAVALVTAYLDGVLEPDSKRRFEAHLSDCEKCGEHLKQIRVTIAVTGQVSEGDLDPVAREDLMGLYRKWRDDPQPRG